MLGLGLDSLRVRPNPDSTLDANDRAHFEWLYAGITLSSEIPVVITEVGENFLLRRRR